MWAIPMMAIFVGWAGLNLVFAFVDPPPALARLMPRKVWFIFAALPAPWDRRVGMIFNAIAGLALAGFFAKLAFT